MQLLTVIFLNVQVLWSCGECSCSASDLSLRLPFSCIYMHGLYYLLKNVVSFIIWLLLDLYSLFHSFLLWSCSFVLFIIFGFTLFCFYLLETQGWIAHLIAFFIWDSGICYCVLFVVVVRLLCLYQRSFMPYFSYLKCLKTHEFFLFVFFTDILVL